MVVVEEVGGKTTLDFARNSKANEMRDTSLIVEGSFEESRDMLFSLAMTV